MSQEKFAHNFRKLLDENGLNARQLSELTGVSYGRLYKYLSYVGKSGLNASTLETLADFFGVTMDELYRGDL